MLDSSWKVRVLKLVDMMVSLLKHVYIVLTLARSGISPLSTPTCCKINTKEKIYILYSSCYYSLTHKVNHHHQKKKGKFLVLLYQQQVNVQSQFFFSGQPLIWQKYDKFCHGHLTRVPLSNTVHCDHTLSSITNRRIPGLLSSGLSHSQNLHPLNFKTLCESFGAIHF